MLGEDSPDEAENMTDWSSLPWGKGKKTAMALRGLSHDSYPASGPAREVFLDECDQQLSDWEAEWPDRRRAPETMTAEELFTELDALNYEAYGQLRECTGAELEKHMRRAVKIIVSEHCEMREAATQEREREDSSEHNSDGDSVEVVIGTQIRSHPEGLLGARHAGRNQTFFDHVIGERPVRVPQVVQDHYGSVVATYRYVNNTQLEALDVSFRLEEDTDWALVQMCSMVSGVVDGGQAGDMDLELYNALDGTCTAVDPLEFSRWPSLPSLEKAFAYAAMVMGEEEETSATYITVKAPHFDLSEGIIPLLELPKMLDSEGRDIARLASPTRSARSSEPATRRKTPAAPPNATTPLHATFTNAKEDELEEKCINLQRAINKMLKHPTEALRKRQEMSPVVTSTDRCLVTGRDLPRAITDIEKLDAHTQSQLSSNQVEVGGVCLVCWEERIRHRQDTDPGFDPEDYDQVLECMVCERTPGAITCTKHPGIGGKGQPLHPHPWQPSQCPSCSIPIMCNGEIRLACANCQYSFIMPGDGKLDRKPKNPLEALQARTLMYTLTFGGGSSEFLGKSFEVATAQNKLLSLALSTGRGGKAYPITPRMAYYGPLLCTGSTPDGTDGVVLADFQTVELNLMLRDERLKHFSVDMSADALGAAVKKHYPRAPQWESSGSQSATFEKLNIRNAAENEGHFWTSLLGAKWAGDTSRLVTDVFNKLMPSSIGSHCTPPMLLHTLTLCYHTWETRIKGQMRDLTTSRLWAVEREVGMCIRLFYSPDLPDILLRSTLAMKGQEERERAVAFYGSETLDGSYYDESGRKAKEKAKEDASKKKKEEREEASRKARERRLREAGEEQPADPAEAARRTEQSARDKKLAEDRKASEDGKGGGRGKGRGKGDKGEEGHNTGGPATAASGESESPCDPTVDMAQMHLEIKPAIGHLQGERAVSIDKWKFCIPCDSEGREYCPRFQTIHGCPAGPTKCARLHEICERWAPPWQRAFLAAGGAKFWKPLTLESLRSVMPSQAYPRGQSLGYLHRYATEQLDRLLEDVTRPMNVKRPLSKFQSARTDTAIFPLVSSHDLPFQLYSVTGAEISSIAHYTIGGTNAMYDILTRDGGHQVRLCDGTVLNKRCLLLNWAIGTPSVGQQTANQMAAQMVMDVTERLYELDVNSLNPLQRELYWNSAFPEEWGYPEELADLIKIDLLESYNLLLFCQGAGKDGGWLVRLWPAGNTVTHAIYADTGVGSKRLKEWLYGFNAEHAGTVAGLSTFNHTEGKHTVAAELHPEAVKFRTLINDAARMVDYAHSPPTFKVVSQGQASRGHPSREAIPVSDEQLKAARAQISADLDRYREMGMISTQARRQGELKPETNTQGRHSISRMLQKRETVPVGDERQPQPKPSEDKPADHTSDELAAMRAYIEFVDNELPYVPRDNLVEMLEGYCKLTDLSSQVTRCCITEDRQPDGWSTIQRIATMIRDLKFEGKAKPGPTLEEVHDSLKLGLNHHHLAALGEVLQQGFDGAYLGKRSGYRGGARSLASGALTALLKNYLKLVQQYKAFPHSARHRDECRTLISEGGIYCPVSATEKTGPTKEPVFDAEGIAKMRQLTDARDQDYEGAYNAGAKSYKTARQLTTDKKTVAGTFIREREENKGYFLLAKGADVSDAFTTLGRHLRGIEKLGASLSLEAVESETLEPAEADEVMRLCRHLKALLFDSLSLVFGGGDQPGGYEIQASATVTSLLGLEWRDPGLNGTTRPNIPRFVDDHLLIVAQRGDRAANHEEDLDFALKQWIGADWENKDKRMAYTAILHGFGFLLNTIREEFSTPWSRILRVEKKLLCYLNTKGAPLTADLAPSVRGLVNFVLEQANGLKPLVLPHLDRVLSSIAREESRRAKGGLELEEWVPSAAMAGESEEYGHEMLRVTLGMLLRLIRLRDGSLLTQPIEQGLDDWYRFMYPGREKPANVSYNHGDGSGDGWYVMNDDSGEEIQYFFSPEEKAAFNRFDSTRCLTIDNIELVPSCLGTPLLAPRLCAEKSQAGTPISMIIEMQDNTVGEHSIESGKTCSSHNWELLSYAGLWSTLTGINKRAVRVRTEDNWLADPGSRPDLSMSEELQAARKKWETEHKRPVTAPSFPEELTSIKDWVDPDVNQDPTARAHRVWQRLLHLLDYYESIGCDLISSRIDHAEVRAVIEDALQDRPIQPSPPFAEDYPEEAPQSAARELLAPIGRRVRVHTRSTLLRDTLNKEIRRTGKTGPEIMIEKGDVINRNINAAMAKQYEKRDVLWQANRNYDPKLPVRTGAPVVHQPFDLQEPIRVVLYQAGMLTWGKSAEDSGGGRTVGLSEWQPFLREDAARVLKSAKAYRDDALLDAQELTRLQAEVGFHGPTCCTHATSNDNPTYNRGSSQQDPAELGLQFERCGDSVSKAYNGIGLAAGWIECVVGAATRGPNGEPSGLDRLKEKMQDFHLQPYTLNSKDILSPLTDAAAAIHEERLYVSYHNKRIWEDPPPKFEFPVHQEHTSCYDMLDSDSETPGFHTMPAEDLEGFQFKYRRGGKDGCIAFIGKILKPNKGFGEGAFPTEAWDGKLGIAPDPTGAQQRWSLREVDGKPALVQPTPAEIAREYQARDVPPELLSPRSEFARYANANQVAQPVADALTVALFEQLLETTAHQQVSRLEQYRKLVLSTPPLHNTSGKSSERKTNAFLDALKYTNGRRSTKTMSRALLTRCSRQRTALAGAPGPSPQTEATLLAL